MGPLLVVLLHPLRTGLPHLIQRLESRLQPQRKSQVWVKVSADGTGEIGRSLLNIDLDLGLNLSQPPLH